MSEKLIEKKAMIDVIETVMRECGFYKRQANTDYEESIANDYSEESIALYCAKVKAWDKIYKALEGLI